MAFLFILNLPKQASVPSSFLEQDEEDDSTGDASASEATAAGTGVERSQGKGAGEGPGASTASSGSEGGPQDCAVAVVEIPSASAPSSPDSGGAAAPNDADRPAEAPVNTVPHTAVVSRAEPDVPAEPSTAASAATSSGAAPASPASGAEPGTHPPPPKPAIAAAAAAAIESSPRLTFAKPDAGALPLTELRIPAATTSSTLPHTRSARAAFESNPLVGLEAFVAATAGASGHLHSGRATSETPGPAATAAASGPVLSRSARAASEAHPLLDTGSSTAPADAAGGVQRSSTSRDGAREVVPLVDLLRWAIQEQEPFKSTCRAVRFLPDESEKHVVVMFRVWSAASVEEILFALASQLGIGSDELPQCGTVTVLPIETARPRIAPNPAARQRSGSAAEDDPDGYPTKSASTPEEGVNFDVEHDLAPSGSTFADSITARVLVDKLIAQISAGADLSFDFLCLVAVASLIAGFGLATNNAVVIVASMLVSPLMGPIMAVTFGAFIFDWPLIVQGIISELCGLLISLACGFLIGISVAPFVDADNNVFGSFVWPTSEMESRGLEGGLIIGILIAIPSGFGVALSVMGNNTTSLVGVAISASILPPLVNCGICWAYSLAGVTYASDRGIDSARFFRLGGISMSLTLVNVVCIFVTAIVMFKIKEAIPFRGKSLLFQTTEKVRNFYRAVPLDVTVEAPSRGASGTQHGFLLHASASMSRAMARDLAHGLQPTTGGAGGRQWHSKTVGSSAQMQRPPLPREFVLSDFASHSLVSVGAAAQYEGGDTEARAPESRAASPIRRPEPAEPPAAAAAPPRNDKPRILRERRRKKKGGGK